MKMPESLAGPKRAAVGFIAARLASIAPHLRRRRSDRLVEQYVRAGRRPWSPGYSRFKDDFIGRVLDDPASMRAFRNSEALPEGFGARLDERVVEYPWVLARLRPAGWIMDAGSTFNTPLILDRPEIRDHPLLVYTLGTDYVTLRPTLSYLFGDLRETVLKDGLFKTIVCISTLEHIGFGLDYKRWSAEHPYPEADRHSYRQALAEFRRLLSPGGQLLLTVPYGRYEDHGWLQQFDAAGVRAIKDAFGGSVQDETYYRYTAAGWQIASAAECDDERYFNIHAATGFAPDFAAAARAVACLELTNA